MTGEQKTNIVKEVFEWIAYFVSAVIIALSKANYSHLHRISPNANNASRSEADNEQDAIIFPTQKGDIIALI